MLVGELIGPKRKKLNPIPYADRRLWIVVFISTRDTSWNAFINSPLSTLWPLISGNGCRYGFSGKSECCIGGGCGGESLGSQKMWVERRVRPQFGPRQWTRVVLPAKLLSRFNYINRPTTTTTRALAPVVMQFKMISRLVFTHTPPPHTSTIPQPWSLCGYVFLSPIPFSHYNTQNTHLPSRHYCFPSIFIYKIIYIYTCIF